MELIATAELLKKNAEAKAVFATQNAAQAAKQKAIKNIREKIRLIERTVNQFIDDIAQDASALGVAHTDLVALKTDLTSLELVALKVNEEQLSIEAALQRNGFELIELQQKQSSLQSKLSADQLKVQIATLALDQWERRRSELEGTDSSPDTLRGLEARLAQLTALPSELDDWRAQRLKLCAEVFVALDEQRQARKELFEPIQTLTSENTLIRDEYRLQFEASLVGTWEALCKVLFAYVKQNFGEFRGEDESRAVVRQLMEKHDLNSKEGAISFVEELYGKIQAGVSQTWSGSIGIGKATRKDLDPADVYDLLFGLRFLEPRYTLRFQDTPIEQLSPGQRGALLLIFYLLVDKGQSPIVLDQPEENLDNESVVNLLVPVLTRAKKKRQIIMVTHNPNLAVVCDAEQVIYSSFDRTTNSTISYATGSIENPMLNLHVVNVLEGTKKAFDNRKEKYHGT